MKQTLMIGYGNTLRSDDGAGQKVAEAFFDQENITAIATHQLTPELVEDLVQVEQVYFIDAAPIETVTIKPIQRRDNEHNFGHFIDPKSLQFSSRNLSLCARCLLGFNPCSRF